MKKIIISLLSITFLWCLSCQEDTIDTYDPTGVNYVQFARAGQDSMTVSFALSPSSVLTLDSLVLVRMSSLPYSDGRSYKIVVDPEFTTAQEGVHFRLPATTSFKAGEVTDSLAITFLRHPDMKNNRFRLVLRIEKNEHFGVGQIDFLYKVIWVHDQLSQPAWWTTSIANSYLGAYSDKKFQFLIDVTEVSDLTDATPSVLRVTALQLKYYLEAAAAAGNPVYDEANNEYMSVPVSG